MKNFNIKMINTLRSSKRAYRLLSLALMLFWAVPAFAYLDPGTGSIILQGIIASIAAALAAGGVYWSRVKEFFSSLFSSGQPATSQPETEADAD